MGSKHVEGAEQSKLALWIIDHLSFVAIYTLENPMLLLSRGSYCTLIRFPDHALLVPIKP